MMHYRSLQVYTNYFVHFLLRDHCNGFNDYRLYLVNKINTPDVRKTGTMWRDLEQFVDIAAEQYLSPNVVCQP